MTHSESFSDSLCSDQMHLAERELSAFIAANRSLGSVGKSAECVDGERWGNSSEHARRIDGYRGVANTIVKLFRVPIKEKLNV